MGTRTGEQKAGAGQGHRGLLILAGGLAALGQSGCEYRNTQALWHHPWVAREIPAHGRIWWGTKRGFEVAAKSVVTPAAVVADGADNAAQTDWTPVLPVVDAGLELSGHILFGFCRK
jgi:hypothetical protein